MEDGTIYKLDRDGITHLLRFVLVKYMLAEVIQDAEMTNPKVLVPEVCKFLDDREKKAS